MSDAYLRDTDELEAALLPVATEVVGQNQNNSNLASATVVIPSTETFFDYDADLAKEAEFVEEENVEAVVIPNNGDKPNYAGVSDDSKSAVGWARQIGKIKSEEEIESIRNANRKVYSQNYFEERSIKSANQRAKERDREGLQIKNDHIDEQLSLSQKATAEEKKKQQQEQQSEKSKGYQPKGYKIKDYDCKSYETKAYEVTEYKSVYD